MNTEIRTTQDRDGVGTKGLQDWHKARAEARRKNRDVVQLSTLFVAILGILAGASGIFAASQTEEWLFRGFLIGIGALTFALLALLGVQLAKAFSRRSKADEHVDNQLMRIIELDENRLWPQTRSALSDSEDELSA